MKSQQPDPPMDYQPRTIAFLSELIHPPQPTDARAIQKLHNQMFESGHPAYSSFAVTPAGPLLTNPSSRKGAVSQVAFLEDRVQFREELGDATQDSFAERMNEVLFPALPLRGVQVLTGHQVTVRSLINPRRYKDSRHYLHEGMFGFQDELQFFGRSPQLIGMRLVFPPEGEQKNAFSLRIESYNADPRSLYVEIQGSFGPTVVNGQLDDLTSNVHDTYNFMRSRALPFIGQFDATQPS